MKLILTMEMGLITLPSKAVTGGERTGPGHHPAALVTVHVDSRLKTDVSWLFLVTD